MDTRHVTVEDFQPGRRFLSAIFGGAYAEAAKVA
jgi:hypothetical protein